MVMASVIARPRKRSVSRSTPVMMSGASVAGVVESPSSAGSAMCADITRLTPASMAARNGTSSVLVRRRQSERTTGSPTWESTSVSP